MFFGPNLPKKGSYFQFKTDKIDTTIKVCIFELVFVSISHWTNNLEFSDQTCPRRIFMVKNRKSERHHWILHIQINLGTKFQLKQFWFFGPDLPQKGFSGLKQKKWTPNIFYITLHIQISLVRNFSSNWQFLFFGPNLPKTVFPVENRKSEYHHGILYVWISLST